MFDHIQSRPNKQVIGISKNDLRLEFMQLSRRDSFHRPLRPHRHKRRRLDYAVQCSYSPTPRSKEKVWQLPAHLLNQGSTNSCVGHSCAHFIMAAPIMSHTVDAIALWRRAQEIDEFAGNEGTNSGTSVRAGFKALRERNLITSDYRWANDADETLRFILTRGSVVVGSKWYPGMSEPLNGVMRLTGNPGSTGHAYLLFGFSPDQDAFLMANSWGPSWGINGCAFLPYDALDQLMQQDGVVCSAIED